MCIVSNYEMNMPKTTDEQYLNTLTITDEQYLNIIQDINANGRLHKDRTGVGTKRVFGRMYKFPSTEVPIITCKRAAFKNTYAELLWFISGSTNVNDLKSIRKPVEKWWRPFAKEDGDLGPMYGRQLRNYNGQGLDQIKKVINQIKEERDSRRILMTTYNPIEAPLGALYPCHGLMTQFIIDNEDNLHMSTLQRSADVGLGLPHNWISYNILLCMIASVCGLHPGELTYYVNDLHVYNDHMEALLNLPQKSFSIPDMCYSCAKSSIDEFDMSDFELVNYKAGPKVNLKMAV